MLRKMMIYAGLTLLSASTIIARKPAPSAAPPMDSSARIVFCRVMEVFVAQKQEVNAVIFHQRDKTDGPRLGELLKSYSGGEMEFETKDGRQHRATVYRVKSCFGRGLMIIASGEAHLEPQDEFTLRFPGAK